MKTTFAVSALLALNASAASIDYTQNGANWPDLCQTGREQSPIDLTSKATWSDNIGIKTERYRDYTGMQLSNKGYTLQVDLPASDMNGHMTRSYDTGSSSLFKVV